MFQYEVMLYESLFIVVARLVQIGRTMSDDTFRISTKRMDVIVLVEKSQKT